MKATLSNLVDCYPAIIKLFSYATYSNDDAVSYYY